MQQKRNIHLKVLKTDLKKSNYSSQENNNQLTSYLDSPKSSVLFNTVYQSEVHFPGILEENYQNEANVNFTSHSSDFGFITSLLDIKSKRNDNQKMYNDNKYLQYVRQIVAEESVLKKTIQNLKKTTFSTFYDSIKFILQSSDLFFELTCKLKNILTAILNIDLTLDLTEAFQNIVKEACQLLECDRVSIFLANHQTQELWTIIAKGTPTIRIPFGQGLAGFVANSLKPLNVLDAWKDSRFNPQIDKANNYKTKTVLCVPVIDQSNGHLLAVMQAINKNNGFFTKDDEGCLMMMAAHSLNVLKNSISNDEKHQSQIATKKLLNISIKLSKCDTLKQFLIKAKKKLIQFIGTENIKVYLLNEKDSTIFTFNDGQDEKISFDVNCGVAGFSIISRKNQMISNLYNHSSFNQIVDLNTSMPIITHIIWDNYKNQERILGVVEIINSAGINIGVENNKKINFKLENQLEKFCAVINKKLLLLLNNL